MTRAEKLYEELRIHGKDRSKMFDLMKAYCPYSSNAYSVDAACLCNGQTCFECWNAPVTETEEVEE